MILMYINLPPNSKQGSKRQRAPKNGHFRNHNSCSGRGGSGSTKPHFLGSQLMVLSELRQSLSRLHLASNPDPMVFSISTSSWAQNRGQNGIALWETRVFVESTPAVVGQRTTSRNELVFDAPG